MEVLSIDDPVREVDQKVDTRPTRCRFHYLNWCLAGDQRIFVISLTQALIFHREERHRKDGYVTIDPAPSLTCLAPLKWFRRVIQQARKNTHIHSVAIEIQSENRMPYRDKFGFICFKRKSPMRNGRRARCRREGSLNLVQIMVEIGDSWERGVTYVDKDVHEARVKPPNDPPRSKGGH